ncbi:uncharacterized protein BDV17DRAFT_294159 [Aspergillus undulatus]|uniref:uncharacterized protein n=1 Tax=Aspergillus undulatus TaxID=1810928 RepID=UPI003CCD4DC4
MTVKKCTEAGNPAGDSPSSNPRVTNDGQALRERWEYKVGISIDNSTPPPKEPSRLQRGRLEKHPLANREREREQGQEQEQAQQRERVLFISPPVYPRAAINRDLSPIRDGQITVGDAVAKIRRRIYQLEDYLRQIASIYGLAGMIGDGDADGYMRGIRKQCENLDGCLQKVTELIRKDTTDVVGLHWDESGELFVQVPSTQTAPSTSPYIETGDGVFGIANTAAMAAREQEERIREGTQEPRVYSTPIVPSPQRRKYLMGLNNNFNARNGAGAGARPVQNIRGQDAASSCPYTAYMTAREEHLRRSNQHENELKSNATVDINTVTVNANVSKDADAKTKGDATPLQTDPGDAIKLRSYYAAYLPAHEERSLQRLQPETETELNANANANQAPTQATSEEVPVFSSLPEAFAAREKHRSQRIQPKANLATNANANANTSTDTDAKAEAESDAKPRASCKADGSPCSYYEAYRAARRECVAQRAQHGKDLISEANTNTSTSKDADTDADQNTETKPIQTAAADAERESHKGYGSPNAQRKAPPTQGQAQTTREDDDEQQLSRLGPTQEATATDGTSTSSYLQKSAGMNRPRIQSPANKLPPEQEAVCKEEGQWRQVPGIRDWEFIRNSNDQEKCVQEVEQTKKAVKGAQGHARDKEETDKSDAYIMY